MTLGEEKRERVMKAASDLGIHPRNDSDWMWIAEDAALSELPNEWSELENANGDIAYYNPFTKLLVMKHPVMEKFRALLDEQRAFAKNTEVRLGQSKMKSKVGQVLNEVLNRTHKGFPPVTPELVEQLALVLNVESTQHFGLCLELRNMLEELAETQYDVAIMIKQPIDPSLFLAQCRKAVIRHCVTSKPDSLLMCQECEKKSARDKCEQCKDFFCMDCFEMTHISGKRKGHTKLDVVQMACDVCDVNHATTCSLDVRQGCGEKNFCDVCLQKKSAELSGHRTKCIKDLKCTECEKEKATRLCEECCDLFCIECFTELHRRGKRRVHMPLILDENGQLIREGVHLPPLITQKMIAKARMSANGGPWVAFKDDQFSTYWYHFGDKLITRQSPYS